MSFPKPAAVARGVAPLVFVFLWSSGWIVARAASQYADPLTFLATRFAITGAALLTFAVLFGAPWPRTRAERGSAMIVGVLVHGTYTGCVWWAVSHGVPISISALLAALQPIMTAALAPALARERVGGLRWLGISIGLAGLVLVLWPKLAALEPGQVGATLSPLLVNVAGMIAITLGTFYQKRFVRSGDLRTVTVLQYAGATAILLPTAYLLEPMRINWNLTLVLVMVWAVLAVSIGAVVLLMLLIRYGEVSRAAQLTYLVPPTAAVQAYVLFGERLTVAQVAGLAVTALGVAIASRRST